MDTILSRGGGRVPDALFQQGRAGDSNPGPVDQETAPRIVRPFHPDCTALFHAVAYDIRPVLMSTRIAACRFIAERWSKHGANRVD
ncbi:hypothetical protein [Streptosporangium sp. NPDC000509]|uniref:hypothetical protein n=1 Tax=Streptosporangium sp. NPDC000509 TaxID=3366186 RepID=UPI0036CA76A0